MPDTPDAQEEQQIQLPSLLPRILSNRMEMIALIPVIADFADRWSWDSGCVEL